MSDILKSLEGGQGISPEQSGEIHGRQHTIHIASMAVEAACIAMFPELGEE